MTTVDTEDIPATSADERVPLHHTFTDQDTSLLDDLVAGDGTKVHWRYRLGDGLGG
ncbi:hypothetical protein ACFWBN_22520 [Streptomyces sp. NPDC059989]|uniref:hypothetical protein n=1 Tax=Streptomyces sp. NPDC059989 TaxID=3347026 RepID=UPI0036CC2C69